MNKWSKEKIKKELRKLSKKLGRSPSISECKRYFEEGDLVKACYRYFGSWNKAKKEVGLEVYRNYNDNPKWTKEKVLRKLEEATKEIGHSPKIKEIVRIRGRDLVEACRKYFGSFNEAKERLGLETYRAGGIAWDKEKIKRELKKLSEKLDHSPTRKEVDKYYKKGDLGRACRRYFGSFNKVKEMLGLEKYWEEHKLPESAKELSLNLGYILGVCMTDAHVSEEYIKLSAKDKEFVDLFAKFLSNWSNVDKIYKGTKTVDGIEIYFLSLGSREACTFLREKLKNLDWILDTPREFKKMVLKGLFDGDGVVDKNHVIAFDNTDQEVLDLFEKLCSHFKIETRRYKMKSGQGREYTRIFLSNIPSKLRFYNLIGITISRKEEKVKDWLEKHRKRKEAYKLAMKMRKGKKYGDTIIHRKLKEKGYNIPKWTIHHWIHDDVKPKIIRYDDR